MSGQLSLDLEPTSSQTCSPEWVRALMRWPMSDDHHVGIGDCDDDWFIYGHRIAHAHWEGDAWLLSRLWRLQDAGKL